MASYCERHHFVDLYLSLYWPHQIPGYEMEHLPRTTLQCGDAADPRDRPLAGTGIGTGLEVAIFAVRPLAMFLTPEVRPTDPSTFVSVPAALFAVALSAIVSPALRAIRVDPITALHND